MTQPFFSIGLTTYNRELLLKEAVGSILSQTFGDFEVIIGNDYVERPISLDKLGISDKRIRVINHTKNLREVANMNALLAEASGKFFTWLADDDFYHPGFLAKMESVLKSDARIHCCFTNYSLVQKYCQPLNHLHRSAKIFAGAEFLDEILAGKMRTIMTYGVFDTKIIKALGGIEPVVVEELARQLPDEVAITNQLHSHLEESPKLQLALECAGLPPAQRGVESETKATHAAVPLFQQRGEFHQVL